MAFSNNQTHRQLVTDKRFYLGQNTSNITMAHENTYAGVIITDKLTSKNAISNACKKGRRMINSLLNIGVHRHGMNPIFSTKLLRTVVMPAVLYGCELWTNISRKSAENLETFQRFAARRIQGLDPQSPTPCTVYTLGLLTMEKSIHKNQLYFWNRLCRSEFNHFYKKLFIARLCTFPEVTPKPKQGFVKHIHQIMEKYKIDDFFQDYLIHREIPSKREWKLFIVNVIHSASHNEWRKSLSDRPNLNRFATIQKEIYPHPLWTLSLNNLAHTWKLSELIILSMTYEPSEVNCKLCQRKSTDIVHHFIMDCPKLYTSREHLMDLIVNVLSVESYVMLTYKPDNEFVNALLGSRDDMTLSDDNWSSFMIAVSTGISTMLKDMKSLL
jgi:hypothetical protein